MNHRGIVLVGFGGGIPPTLAPRVCVPCLFAVHDRTRDEARAAMLKAEVVASVTREINFMKKSLFGTDGSIARKARRSKQTWLRRLHAGG